MQTINPLFLREVRLNPARVVNGVFPFTLPSVATLSSLCFDSQVTFFVGENGTGKSTVLEAIACAWGLNPEGGSRNFRFASRESHSTALADSLVLSRGVAKAKDAYFLRAESFYNVASEIERLDVGIGGPRIIDSHGGKSLHAQSHGESFMSLLQHRFKSEGFYVLDEPEAALSPKRQLAAVARINDLAKKGAQFLIATHSPLLLAYPDATILECSKDGIRKIVYDDCEHVQLYRMFLEKPERMLSELLNGS